MTDTHAAAPPPAIESDLRLVSALVYGLYLFAICNGITALVAVVIAYVKRGDARGTVYESHFNNAITIFWAGLFFMVVFVAAVIAGIIGVASFFPADFWTMHAHHWHMHGHWNWPSDHWQNNGQWTWPDGSPFAVPHQWWPLVVLLPIAHVGILAFGFWFLYRVIRGLLRALEAKPY